jgi:hypothetical protein
MGYSFTYPILRWLGGATVAAYVHYPTISTDMLARVEKKEAGATNESVIARSAMLTNLKLVYGDMDVGKCDIVIYSSSSFSSLYMEMWMWENAI